MTEFSKTVQRVYDQLRADPEFVTDRIILELYDDGLNDRMMPQEGDTVEWAAWVAGRRTRIDRGLL